MEQITDIEVKKRFTLDNPWWETGKVDRHFTDMPRRAYFDGFYKLLAETDVRRAVVMMGPRRVGKTVMIYQAVQKLLDNKVPARNILYISLDTPFYTGIWLEKLLTLFMDLHRHKRDTKLYVIYDEIQYHKDWELHLKVLVDSYRSVEFCASGSAAAALEMKSRESGAGRFTDFILPPLTFAEFLRFREVEDELFDENKNAKDITSLNDEFIDYLNFGGFPEAVMKEDVREGMERYVADDIIDKVLLRDLPSLYGISDPQELNRLFTTLAYNSGNEISIDELSNSAKVTKNTLKKYLDYLEAAFLIRRLYRIDQNARRLKRLSHFKVYLANPCLRTALFGAIRPNDPAVGQLTETAIASQMAHDLLFKFTYYARWKSGEVDFVVLHPGTQKAGIAMEVKWSDRSFRQPSRELSSFLEFCHKTNPVSGRFVTTKTLEGIKTIEGVEVTFSPASVVCYLMARRVDEKLSEGRHPLTNLPFE